MRSPESADAKIVKNLAQGLGSTNVSEPGSWSEVKLGLLSVVRASLGLLRLEDRSLLRRLCCFEDGFTREAATQVALASPPALDRLVDAALLQRGPHKRYRMHEEIRGFLGHLLEADLAEEIQLRTLHARFYLDFLRGLQDDLLGERRASSLRKINSEFSNISKAWRWAVRSRLNDEIAESLEGLYRFCRSSQPKYVLEETQEYCLA